MYVSCSHFYFFYVPLFFGKLYLFGSFVSLSFKAAQYEGRLGTQTNSNYKRIVSKIPFFLTYSIYPEIQMDTIFNLNIVYWSWVVYTLSETNCSSGFIHSFISLKYFPLFNLSELGSSVLPAAEFAKNTNPVTRNCNLVHYYLVICK